MKKRKAYLEPGLQFSQLSSVMLARGEWLGDCWGDSDGLKAEGYWYCCCHSSTPNAPPPQPGDPRGDPAGEPIARRAASLRSPSPSSEMCEKDSQEDKSDIQLLEERLLQGLGQSVVSR